MILLKKKTYSGAFEATRFYEGGGQHTFLGGAGTTTLETLSSLIDLDITKVIPEWITPSSNKVLYIRTNLNTKQVFEDLGFTGVVSNGYFYCSADPVRHGLGRIVLSDPFMQKIDCSFEKNMKFTSIGTIHYNGKVSRQKNEKLPVAYKFTINGLSQYDITCFNKTINNIGDNQDWLLIDGMDFPFDSEDGIYQVATTADSPELDETFGEYSVSIIISEKL